MIRLSKQQRDQFLQGMEQRYLSDPTYQFLSECVVGLSREHMQQLKSRNKDTFESYVCAERILRRHAEYLAYRLGLEHGNNTE